MGANAELNFAKYRNGSLNRIGLYFDGTKTKFTDSVAADSIASVSEEEDEVPF